MVVGRNCFALYDFAVTKTHENYFCCKYTVLIDNGELTMENENALKS